jgi:hypothetical protein
MMGSIYGRAEMVYTDLGDPERYEDKDASYRESREKYDIFLSPWFTRAWVIQETVLASRITFLWRTKTDLISIDAGMEIFDMRARNAETDAQHLILTRNKRHLSFLKAMKNGFSRKGAPSNIVGLLQYSRSFESQDPRDKVYSLLGMCSGIPIEWKGDCSNTMGTTGLYIKAQSPGSPWKPNYSVNNTVVEVYKKVADICLAGPGGKVILYNAGLSTRIANLPSFVPDWSVEPCYPFTSQLYHCGGPGQMVIIAHTSMEVLWWGGAVIDKVKIAGEPCNWLDPVMIPGRPEVTNSRKFCSAVHSMAQKLMNDNMEVYAVPGEPLAEALWRTLVADVSPHLEGPRGLRRNHASDRYYYESFLQECEERSPCSENMAAATEREHDVKMPSRTAAAASFRMNIEEMQGGRRFCITENQYVGVLPNTAEDGDLIAVFLGANLPFVIRPVEGTLEESYYLVGACYIHGIMDGELVACDQDDGSRKIKGEEPRMLKLM